MPQLLCCCCSSPDRDERRPLLRPAASELSAAGSVRQAPPACTAPAARQTGRLVMRRVHVSELDQRFSDVADTFNEQQHNYEAMVQHVSRLQRSCGCGQSETPGLAVCVEKIREEHQAAFSVSLKMSGYDFHLSVVPVGSDSDGEDKPLPPRLRLARDELRATSESARATIARGATLQELLAWLLRSRGHMAELVKEAAPSFQEQGRLSGNLEENLREVTRARELLEGYRERAGAVLTEAAQIAGANL